MAAQINRRTALTVVAAAPVAIAAGALATGGEPGELAALIRRYWAEVDEFNNTEHETDEESDAHAATTFEITEEAMMSVPARTREDALAALDVVLQNGRDYMLELADEFTVDGALLRAVRDYIASA